MRAVDALESLELLGSTQWGLVTATQAQEAGVTKVRLSRLTDQGTLRRVRHGVYALPSADTGPLQDLRAAWLTTGSWPVGHQPLVVVSGESAAAVHQLGDLLPSVHEFSTQRRRQTTQPDVRYRKRHLAQDEVTRVDGLPVTTVARTVADLAADGTDFDHLASVVRDALRAPDTSFDDLLKVLGPSAGRFGFRRGGDLLVALLKESGYSPDVAALNVVTPELQAKLLKLVAPQLEAAFSQVLREQFQQSLPSVDLTPFTGQMLDSMRPQLQEMTRALVKMPPVQWPGLPLVPPKQGGALSANRAHLEEAPDDARSVPAAGGASEEVTGSQAGRRSSKARRSRRPDS